MKDKLKNSKYTRQFKILTSGIIYGMLLILYSCNSNSNKPNAPHKEHAKEEVYYCQMDTEVVQKKPGVCPICKMNLTKRPVSAQADTFNFVLNPTNSTVLSTVKAIKPVVKSFPVTVKAWGYVTYDTRRIATVASRVGEGRVDKLYIKYVFQPIKKGQPLLDIFSHELLSAQKDYFTLKEIDSANNDLIEAAKKKLVLLGMTESQVNALKHDGHVHPTTTIYSPYSGYVIENTSEDISSGSMTNSSSGGMSTESSNNSANNNSSMKGNNKELLLREGTYLSRGATIFKVVNTDVVWGMFEVYTDQLPLVKLNQKVTIAIENLNMVISGKVDFIEPNYQQGSKTARFRVYLENKNQKLKIGNLLTGKVDAGSKEGIWIPRSAFYDLGIDKIVFVKKGNVYETQKITIGTMTENYVHVVSGLSANEEIAENAQFMVDSEAFIKVKNE